jgi:hypothetical protein
MCRLVVGFRPGYLTVMVVCREYRLKALPRIVFCWEGRIRALSFLRRSADEERSLEWVLFFYALFNGLLFGATVPKIGFDTLRAIVPL